MGERLIMTDTDRRLAAKRFIADWTNRGMKSRKLKRFGWRYCKEFMG